jgi:hypothetical protein
MNKFRVYISGPISGMPKKRVRSAFDQAASQIASCGEEPVKPPRLQNPIRSHQGHEYLNEDLFVLRSCNLMVLLEGWWQSSGCMREIWFASRNRIKVCQLRWLKYCISVMRAEIGEIPSPARNTLQEEVWKSRGLKGPFIQMRLVSHAGDDEDINMCPDIDCPLLFHSGSCLLGEER